MQKGSLGEMTTVKNSEEHEEKCAILLSLMHPSAQRKKSNDTSSVWIKKGRKHIQTDRDHLLASNKK